jgi:hypothetical protein
MKPPCTTLKFLFRWHPTYDPSLTSFDPTIYCSNVIFDYWRIMVPRVLAPTRNSTSLSRRTATAEATNERVMRTLLAPLEAFICGGNGLEKEVFEVRATSKAKKNFLNVLPVPLRFFLCLNHNRFRSYFSSIVEQAF